MSHLKFLTGNTGISRIAGYDGRPQGAILSRPLHSRPSYATMLVLFVHRRDGGGVERWVAPCGRPISIKLRIDEFPSCIFSSEKRLRRHPLDATDESSTNDW